MAIKPEAGKKCRTVGASADACATVVPRSDVESFNLVAERSRAARDLGHFRNFFHFIKKFAK